MAALRALQLFTSSEIAICTDSEYVILRAAGAAKRWKLRGRKGSSGPVSNASLGSIIGRAGQAKRHHTLGQSPISCHYRGKQ